jgi:6-phosphogluconate dehydrogenase
MSNEEMAALFEEWNKTELSSYLIEITAKILCKKDDKTGEGHVVDYVMDKTGQKGTGLWTIQEAAERGVAAPTLAAALDAQMISSRKDERENASRVLKSPVIQSVDKQEVINDLRAALYASKVCSYAQGLSLTKAASDEFKWDVSLSECARLWMGGCIIRAQLLEPIQTAFAENPDLKNLLVDRGFSAQLNERSDAWRRVVALCITSGIACPSLCSSLTYFDSYRRARLPANLTQAQRDFFGGHTYERIDAEGFFHTSWTAAHKDIGNVSQRTAGEIVQK